MCETLRELMKDEIEESERRARQEASLKARREERQEIIKNLMETMKWTAEQAMTAMKIPVEDREKYMAGL